MKKNAKIPVLILAGGLGTRISEETHLKPKPMIEIGDDPILLHIMRSYYHQGFDDFVICAGYRSYDIKDFFLNYEFRQNHLQIDHRESADLPPKTLGPSHSQERWRVRVIDTGQDTMTGGRIAKALDLVQAETKYDTFAVTYGDGVSDVDLGRELEFHRSHGRIGTVLGVPPLARFGELNVAQDQTVTGFLEKPESHLNTINGGFFFFQSAFREYLDTSKECILERAPLEALAKDGQLKVFQHRGFWQPMDTLRDKTLLQKLWETGKAPWIAPLK
jgi:glucose-1-phosphate cytidylyltransferase